MEYNTDTAEVKKLAQYLEKIACSVPIKGMDPYETPVLICVDAVLSICRRYQGFVVPRIDYFKRECPDIKTLAQLKALIKNKGPEGFVKCWNYNDLGRVHTLYHLAEKLLEVAEPYSAKTEMDSLKLWAKSVDVEDFSNFGVKGIGIATFQYLRIMLGVPTVKPDIHIKKAVSVAVGRKITNDLMVIKLFTEACKVIGVPADKMDYAIWKIGSEGAACRIE